MDLSIQSVGTVTSPSIEKYATGTMPPASMRSSESVVSQVKETLFSFLRKPNGSKGGDDGENREDGNDDESNTHSKNQRTNEAFLERIGTFSTTNWMGKPLSLSPPLLAQYGWQCIGLDAVKCCSCSAIFSVRLPWPDAANYRDQCLMYRQKVLTAHMKICSWPSYSCPDSFVSPFLHGGAGSGEIREGFIERKKHLLQLGVKLPQLERTVLKQLNLTEAQLLGILQVQTDGVMMTALEHPDVDEEYYIRLSQNETATVLAMCGWDTKCTISSPSPSLYCKSSGRSVGLWNFFSFIEDRIQKVDEVGSEAPGSPLIPAGTKRPPGATEDDWTPKRARKSSESHQLTPSPMAIKKQFFHPLQQHHPWSSWITVLKPISADEFEDEDDVDSKNITTHTKYKHIINPVLRDKKPGWGVLRDVLLKKKYETEEKDETRVELAVPEDGESKADNDPDGDKSPTKDQGAKELKSPKAAVYQIRKMIKEWSSP